MEIGSMDTMAGMMGMQGGMSGMRGAGDPPPKPDAEEMSSKFIDALDSDGDGSLTQAEFAAGAPDGVDSTQSAEKFDALDTNEDGFVSQEELEADMESHMGDMKAKMESGSFGGIQQNGDMTAFQQLMDMVGGLTEQDQAQGAERYSQMQESMYGSSTAVSTVGLNLSA